MVSAHTRPDRVEWFGVPAAHCAVCTALECMLLELLLYERYTSKPFIQPFCQLFKMVEQIFRPMNNEKAHNHGLDQLEIDPMMMSSAM